MTKVSVGSILGREYVDTESEFTVLMCVAQELQHRGYSLDFVGVGVDFSRLSLPNKSRYNELIRSGGIIASAELTDFEPVGRAFDPSMFRSLDLFFEEGGKRVWSPEHAQATYGELRYHFLRGDHYSPLLQWMSAIAIVDNVLGTDRRPLRLILGSDISKSVGVYLDLISLLSTVPSLNAVVSIEAESRGLNDLEWGLFCYNAKSRGTIRQYSVQEKLELLEVHNFKPGGIYLIGGRIGLNESNLEGRIERMDLVRLDSIEGDTLQVTRIPTLKSLEFLREDLNNLDEELQASYSDVLDIWKQPLRSENISLYNLAVEGYFFREDSFIFNLDQSEVIDLLFTAVDKPVLGEVTCAEAVFLLLRQRGIEFDEDLFKENNAASYNVSNLFPVFLESLVAPPSHVSKVPGRAFKRK